MGALEAFVAKLKRWLGRGAPDAPARADAAPPDEQEQPTNAKPSGASDEPWPP